MLEQWSDAKADTLTLEQANLILNFGHDQSMLAKEGEMSVNSLLTKKLADMVKALDSTRPVTAGCNEPNPNNHLFRSEATVPLKFYKEILKDSKQGKDILSGKTVAFGESLTMGPRESLVIEL